jgi:serine/threonine protein kinase
MAPELFKDDGVLSFYSDFWSLGIVMYEMASGKLPFNQGTLQKVLKAVTEEPF